MERIRNAAILVLVVVGVILTNSSCLNDSSVFNYPPQQQARSPRTSLTHFNYFPLAVGNRWVYRQRSILLIPRTYPDSTFRLLDTNSVADTMTIQGKVEDTTGTWWSIWNQEYRPEGNFWWPIFSAFQYRAHRDTIYERGSYRGIPIGGLKYIPVTIVDSLSYASVGNPEYFDGTDIPFDVTARVAAGPVETPAGVFGDCSEYHYSYYLSPKNCLYVTEYVAPHIGLVKRITEHRDSVHTIYTIIGYKELASYSVEGGTRSPR